MYSIVVLMSMSGGMDLPDCHRRRGCCGCYGDSCGGCYGGGCYGGGCSGGYGPPPARPMAAPPAKEEENAEADDSTTLAPQSAPAEIRVQLPADARLTVNGTVSRSAKSVRKFVTSALPPGASVEVSLSAKLQRGDKTFTVSRRIQVAAGQRVRVTLAFPELSVAQR